MRPRHYSISTSNEYGMDIISGASAVLTIVGVVATLSKKLNEVRDSYNSVALNIQLAAIQLATIRDALEAIAEWRLSNHSESQASKNLDATLAESLKGCAVLITVIDGKLGEAGYTPGVKRKIRHMWLEDVLKGYMSNLDGQVRALQLLLTSFQWWATSLYQTSKEAHNYPAEQSPSRSSDSSVPKLDQSSNKSVRIQLLLPSATRISKMQLPFCPSILPSTLRWMRSCSGIPLTSQPMGM